MSSATPRENAEPAADSTGGTPPAANRAYEHVKARLLDGRYPDGELLSEGDVASDLQMSRTPVREAFLRLQTEGFLKLYPKRGALVVPVSPTEARALLEARLALETFAINKLAAFGPDEVAETGRRLVTHPACDGSGVAPAELHEVDRGFHADLVAATENPVITDLYGALRDRQMRITSTARTHEPDRRATIARQHLGIAEALRDGDAELAKARLRTHLLDTARALGVAGGPMLEDGQPPAAHEGHL